MTGCEKYEELISGYMDGALSAAEKAELIEHLKVCPGCASLMKTYIQLFAPEERVQAPAGFTASVMNMTSVAQAPQRAKKRGLVIRIAALAAACLVLVFALYPLIRSMSGVSAFSAKSSDAAVAEEEVMLTMAVAECGEDCEPECADEYAANDFAYDDATCSVEDDAVANDGAALMFSCMAEESVAEENMYDEGLAMSDYARENAVVISVTGELPEYCAVLDFADCGDGSLIVQIDPDLAERLIEEEFIPEGEGEEYYLVWYPVD